MSDNQEDGFAEELVSPDNEGRGVTIDDFVAYMPAHSYICTLTREMWPAVSVNVTPSGSEATALALPFARFALSSFAVPVSPFPFPPSCFSRSARSRAMRASVFAPSRVVNFRSSEGRHSAGAFCCAHVAISDPLT